MSATETNIGGSINARQLQQPITLQYNSDVVTYCQHEQYNNICAVGNYELNNDTRIKTGCIYLYQLSNSSDNNNQVQLQQLCQTPTCAVLDLQWSYNNNNDNKPLLSMAGEDGYVYMYNVTQDTHNQYTLQQHTKQHITNGLCLSVSWNKQSNNTKLATSDTLGYIHTLTYNDSNTSIDITVDNTIKGHTAEVWCVHCSRHNEHVLYSGSDDCMLNTYDIRSSNSITHQNKHSHTAGICYIQTSPHNEYIIATGSYDEYIRLFDIRNLTNRQPLYQHRLYGGVWRIVWHPHIDNRIVTACMHNGLHVIDVDFNIDNSNNNNNVTVSNIHNIASYMEHTSLSYGVDWCYNTQYRDILTSCSFYDKQLHLWKIHNNT